MMPSKGTSPRVLIVDDSSSIRRYVADLLSSAGYQFEVAEDGRKGVEAVKSFKPDVMLLDVEMPGISGLEVLAELNQSLHYYSILMFTSLSSLPQIVQALREGADDYITKPFNDEELLARVEAAVRTARMKAELVEARQAAEDALATLKRAQEQLVVEEKIASIARLSAGVAHNINNPLGFIISNLSSLDRYSSNILAHADELSQRLQGFGREECDHVSELENKHRIRQIRRDLKPLIEETREGFERIALIVKRLSRLELALTQQHDSMSFDLVPFMEALTKSLPSSFPSSVSFVWRAGGSELPVKGALTLLNAAIEELLTNAAESIRGVGVVTVTTDRLGDDAILTIRDTGEGIPELQLKEIFEPFFTSRIQQSHVGLGLTIAERFIDMLGGKILIDSQASVGTTVTVRLPLANPGNEE